MEYNGNRYTWTQFKDYWAKKPTGGWLYDDLKNQLDEVDRRRCQTSWMLAGPLYCHKKGIHYVDYNQAEDQQKQTTISKAHIIFALDESSSMAGLRWANLIKAL